MASAPQPVRCEQCHDHGIARDALTAAAGFCTCPVGVAKRAAADAASAREAEELTQHLQFHVAGVIAGMVLPARVHDFTLASFPRLSDPAARQTDELVEDWLAEWEPAAPSWLLLHGDFGRGKTGRAVGVAKALIAKMGWECRSASFVVASELVAALYRAMHDHELAHELRRCYWDADLLVLDDVGADYGTGWTATQYFDLLNHRYDRRLPTILTTNKSPGDLAAHLSERVMWRVVEACRGDDGMIACEGVNLHDPSAVAEASERMKNPRRLQALKTVTG